MSNMKFSEDHGWIRMESADVGVVGITDFAQQQLGDLVHVELPKVGAELKQAAEAAVIESVKTASELLSPVSGTVLAINEDLPDDPVRVNQDATGAGWIMKIKLSNVAELNDLMDEAAYSQTID